MQKVFLYALAALFSLSIFAQETELEKSMLFYENCESLAGYLPGLSIKAKFEGKGRFGNCFRIERKTVNCIENGDFLQKNSDSMILDEKSVIQEKQGMDSSGCLKMNSGKLAIPVLDIEAGVPNAFSFYVRKLTGSCTISVIWETCGKSVMLKKISPSTEWERLTIPVASESDSGTLRLIAEGELQICKMQLDKGLGFFNTFVPPLSKSTADKILIPSDKGYFNTEQGAFSCWISSEWLEGKASGKEMCVIFAVKSTPISSTARANNDILRLTCGLKRKVSDKHGGTLWSYVTDSNNRSLGLQESLESISQTENSPWHFIVFNWEMKESNMRIGLSIDGRALMVKEGLFGPARKASSIVVGYVDGGYLNGLIDDFAIFNRALTDEEIGRIYRSNQALSALINMKNVNKKD